MCILHFIKDKIAANLLLSIGTCHAEKVAAQMDGGQRLWTTLHSMEPVLTGPAVVHLPIEPYALNISYFSAGTFVGKSRTFTQTVNLSIPGLIECGFSA